MARDYNRATGFNILQPLDEGEQSRPHPRTLGSYPEVSGPQRTRCGLKCLCSICDKIILVEKRVFLVHGWEGRPDNHWFPWLVWELKARGYDVYAITMPNADNPKVDEWVGAIKAAVGRPTAATYFVGHSLGCIATARYFEQLPPTARVGGAVFVAGFSSDLGISQISEFTAMPIDFDQVKKHCLKFVNIFSDNDDYVSLAKSLEFQKNLSAKSIIERGKGHFTKSEGVDALPSVFKELMGISTLKTEL